MNKIKGDFELLKSQGLKPHIWLECQVGQNPLVYFDGVLTSYDSEIAEYKGEGPQMFIQLRSIKNFSIESLRTLKELNHYLYDNTKTYTFEYTGEDEFFYVDDPVAYFDLLRTAIRKGGKGISLRGEVTLDAITVSLEENTNAAICITYEEGLESFYKRITVPLQDSKEVLGRTSQGISYFVPRHDPIADSFYANIKPFNPTTFEKLNNTITLIDTTTQERREYDLDRCFYILAEYCKEVEGLREVLDKFTIEFTACQLVSDTRYLDYISGTKLYKDSYNVDFSLDRNVRDREYFMLPNKDIVTLFYKANYSGRNTLQDNLDVLAPDYESKVTPSNLNAKLTLCRQNNILVITPLYVTSISFVENKLNIGVYCMVRLGISGYEFMVLPLTLLDLIVATKPDNTVYCDMEFCKLQIPYSSLPYLTGDITMEEVGEKMKSCRLSKDYYERLGR